MKILVIAEHNNEIVKASTFSTINAASQIDQNIDVLVVGSGCNNVTSELSNTQYIKKILLIDDIKFQNPIAENISKIITSCAAEYTHILAPASTFGKNIMPRVAALLDVAQISDIIKIEGEDTFVRPIYAGNALATVQSHDSKKVITVRPTSFDAVSKEGGNGEIQNLDLDIDISKVEFIGREENKSDRPELGSARIVISGGRGLGSAENFSLLNKIADKLNAAIGASRAAVDAGYLSLIHI